MSRIPEGGAFRTATMEPGCIRLRIGLEDVGGLTADLERGFAAMHQAVDAAA